MNARTAWTVLAVACLLWTPVWAGEQDALSTEDLLELEIDELLEMDVSSVARKQQKLSEVAAALTVLTPEEVKRSGHIDLAEMLRLVPGFHVARLDANKWSVSARGFSGRFTDKLLVMIDGRSVYTPTFAGVYWDIQGVFLPDLDRIEAIRGPGATAWGANAVNGVVSVRTKSAKDTVGAVFEALGGAEATMRVGGRVGWAIDDTTWIRVHAGGLLHDEAGTATGVKAADDWHVLRAGFRVDGEPDTDRSWTVQGEIYRGKSGERLVLPTLTAPFATAVTADQEMAGGHVLGRWRRTFSPDSELEIQAYFDRTERPTTLLGEERSTFDLDLQHRFRASARHEIIWGARYRVSADRFTNSSAIVVTPTRRTDHLFSAFIQDEITIVPDTLVLTVGTKIEHNDYTGFEAQPSARLAWQPRRRHTVWAAVSRAVRTPSRVDHDVRINTAVLPGPTVVGFFGSDSFESEELLAFEMGHRFAVSTSITIELAGYYNVYDGLRTLTNAAPFGEATPAPAHAVAPSLFTNLMDGEVYGGELVTTWRMRDNWRLVGTYSVARLALHTSTDRIPVDGEANEGDYPRNMASLRSQFDLGDEWQIDVSVSYVDSLPSLGIPPYLRLDFRVGWVPSEDLRIDLVVQNVLDDRHPEFVSELPFLQSSETETVAFLRVTYSW